MYTVCHAVVHLLCGFMAYHYTTVVLVQGVATTCWRQIQKLLLCVLHTLFNWYTLGQGHHSGRELMSDCLSLVMENSQWAYAADWNSDSCAWCMIVKWSVTVLGYSLLFVCPFSLLCIPMRVSHMINFNQTINHSTWAVVKLNGHSVRSSILGMVNGHMT